MHSHFQFYYYFYNYSTFPRTARCPTTNTCIFYSISTSYIHASQNYETLYHGTFKRKTRNIDQIQNQSPRRRYYKFTYRTWSMVEKGTKKMTLTNNAVFCHPYFFINVLVFYFCVSNSVSFSSRIAVLYMRYQG
jgi:hypothetical protein